MAAALCGARGQRGSCPAAPAAVREEAAVLLQAPEESLQAPAVSVVIGAG